MRKKKGETGLAVRRMKAGVVGWRKWYGEKAQYEARYFPRGERSLFTSPLSQSAPRLAWRKKFRFSCGGSATVSYFSCSIFATIPTKTPYSASAFVNTLRQLIIYSLYNII